jgi:hypothetical protein
MNIKLSGLTILIACLLDKAKALSHCQYLTRSDVLKGGVCAAISLLVVKPVSTSADVLETRPRKLNLSNEQLKSIITADVIDRQFLATADLTRDIYDSSSATFTDEIDTYSMDKWIQGTKKLFVGENSRVRLVGEVNVSAEQADFRFDEDLQFRIPFRPTVHLTGKVVLKRDKESGLITSYQEFWDQSVNDVLKTVKF